MLWKSFHLSWSTNWSTYGYRVHFFLICAHKVHVRCIQSWRGWRQLQWWWWGGSRRTATSWRGAVLQSSPQRMQVYSIILIITYGSAYMVPLSLVWLPRHQPVTRWRKWEHYWSWLIRKSCTVTSVCHSQPYCCNIPAGKILLSSAILSLMLMLLLRVTTSQCWPASYLGIGRYLRWGGAWRNQPWTTLGDVWGGSPQTFLKRDAISCILRNIYAHFRQNERWHFIVQNKTRIKINKDSRSQYQAFW